VGSEGRGLLVDDKNEDRRVKQERTKQVAIVAGALLVLALLVVAIVVVSDSNSEIKRQENELKIACAQAGGIVVTDDGEITCVWSRYYRSPAPAPTP
jgi:hypothetical protein